MSENEQSRDGSRKGRPAVRSLSLLVLSLQAFVLTIGSKSPGALPEIEANVLSRRCAAPFALRLTSPVNAAVIRYTVDGSEPTAVNGSDYSGSVSISKTTVLRAAAFKADVRVSSIVALSYMFLDQVLRQPNDPPGFPVGPRAWNGQPAAYGMDPRVVDDPRYHDRMAKAFDSLAILSIICPKDDLFNARTGLYVNSQQTGEAWERPCSAELLPPDGREGFHIDCGLQIQGGQSRVPSKSPKHSFRLLFKAMYGRSRLEYQLFPDSRLKEFNTLVLRADFNNSWVHWDDEARPRAQRTRDAWLKDSHRAMGWVAPHNRYLHLFLNGLYWGIYDVTERPDASFAAAYFGGARKDYDVINEHQAKDGTIDAFNALMLIRDVRQNSQYQKLQQSLNVPEFIDYLLLNYYAGNKDVGEYKNWYAIRRRTPAGPFQYVIWDGEQILHNVTDDTINRPYVAPFRMAEELRANAEFRLAFADHVQNHFFNAGALTPPAAAARWMKRAGEVDSAIIAESARWGYYRRDPPFTRDDDWLAEQRRLTTSYFPQRTGVVLKQLEGVGLFSPIAAPIINQQGGEGEAFYFSLHSNHDSKVYYTTDGSDPRVYGTGTISPTALLFNKPVPVHGVFELRARALKDKVWSPLTAVNLPLPAASMSRN